jgi:hypothetical protein
MADIITGGAIGPLLMPLNWGVATVRAAHRTRTLQAFNTKPSVKSFSNFGRGGEKKVGRQTTSDKNNDHSGIDNIKKTFHRL